MLLRLPQSELFIEQLLSPRQVPCTREASSKQTHMVPVLAEGWQTGVSWNGVGTTMHRPYC